MIKDCWKKQNSDKANLATDDDEEISFASIDIDLEEHNFGFDAGADELTMMGFY
jgi:hypothetical protein